MVNNKTNTCVYPLPTTSFQQEIEIVERKGIGHPDTLADALAENLSVAYSNYTLQHFGVVLHHNFDKLGILGGRSDVTYGYGKLTSPVRVLLNGRASISFSSEQVPVRDILEEETKRFFKEIFGELIDPSQDIELHYNLNNVSGPGKIRETKGSRAHLFNPRSINEVKGYDRLVSNDTSIGCSYAPLSAFEQAILSIEQYLNSQKVKDKFPWIGTDIKVTGVRVKNKKSITVCVPQIAKYVPSQSRYKENIATIKSLIKEYLYDIYPDNDVELFINTRDDYEKQDIYLTAIGSSIESGDEGLVGRGNRINGLMTPLRPMSIEGICGKNPVYYVGKIYNIVAFNIANSLYKETNQPNEVFLVGQNGRDLLSPWKSIVKIYESQPNEELISSIIEKKLEEIPKITQRLLRKEIKLY
ncbi:MAG: methionine adenosyltransferase [Nitrososphaerales archaeon]